MTPDTFPMSSLGNWDDQGCAWQIEEIRAIPYGAGLLALARRSLLRVSAKAASLSRWLR